MNKNSVRGAVTISFGEVCDRGKVREENQDQVRSASIPLGELFVVADGIGGYQGGATASRMVVDGLHGQLARRAGDDPAERALQEAAAYTNMSIYREAQSGDASLQRMGSTVVMALIQQGTQGSGVLAAEPIAWVGHVGDSRAYLIRDGQMRKVTNDHSAVQALLNRNLITEAEAKNHPDSSVLTRSLGHRPEVELEIDRILLQSGDALLLCSDGLWGYVEEGDIAAVVTDTSLSVQTTADTLLHQALAAGGHDNIGIQFIRIGNVVPQSDSAVDTPLVSPEPSSKVEMRMTSVRRQQIIAVALLLLGSCGYLGYARISHNWPFAMNLGATNHKGGASVAVESNGGLPADGKRPDSSAGSVKEAQSSGIQPNPERKGARKIEKSILVVGDLSTERAGIVASGGSVRWKHIRVTRESNSACASLAAGKPVVYVHSSGELKEMLEQHPELIPSMMSANVVMHFDHFPRDCGKYDAILIMPRKL